ncbi:hypothetical protein P9209_11265 [Prescottella defluvii]|nr:hypothetical protein P9209_11265 [Prescottella defluvii]
MDLVFTDTEQVATRYESLAASCRDWADTIEDAHHKILAILAGALGAGLIIGGIAGFFTAGTGAAAAAGAAGSAAGASIVTVLVAFDTAAAVAVGATPPPVSRSAEWPPTYNPCSKQTPPCSTRAPAEAEAEAHTTTSRHRRTCQDSRTHGP